MIVVFDTNVWISALVFSKPFSTPFQALAKAISEDLIATCEEIEEEILRVLVGKFTWHQSRARLTVKNVLARSLSVTIQGAVRQCRDPDDDKFLECALLANAHALIAGDRDLLVLREYRGTKIITPAQYVSGKW